MAIRTPEKGFGIVTLTDLPKGTRIPFYGKEVISNNTIHFFLTPSLNSENN
jgi:hypothetical protein